MTGLESFRVGEMQERREMPEGWFALMSMEALLSSPLIRCLKHLFHLAFPELYLLLFKKPRNCK